LAGKHDFNECVFEDVVVPADRLIGQEGDGWRQVTGELALERSGPERILSTFHLFAALVEAAGPEPEPRLAEAIGRLTAELYALRAMSLAVAGQLEKGELPEVEAAFVKDMGTCFEAEVAETLRRAVPLEPVAGGSANAPSLESSLGASVLGLPSFTLRGGTNEVLRSIIARGLGVR
ncbi:MAG: acyl-CoA dehydrogenase family protein, partial [Rhodospirillaceae bacterium]|nr:acyl-CoA dehydrogenase family protein [Rhodospirillaceae bacterium]